MVETDSYPNAAPGAGPPGYPSDLMRAQPDVPGFRPLELYPKFAGCW